MSSYCKFYKEKKQVSYDNGITWSDVVPAEYRKGELIQTGSMDCQTGPTGYSTQYLTFVAVSAGTFSFVGSSSSTINNSSIQYSIDNGSTWYTLNRNTQTPRISAGQKIMWKGNLSPTSLGVGYFTSTSKFNIESNAMSLLYGDNFLDKTDLTGKNDAFYMLFDSCTYAISAEHLVLPATTLSEECYMNMFQGCTSLVSVPVLPATTLAKHCYFGMFTNCTGLTTVPSNMLPATTLEESCYINMFDGCSSLTSAPSLPATTLATNCYYQMFLNCTSLTSAPSLPATSLEEYCYCEMFWGCTSLTTAPDLSATTLVKSCYSGMFSYCSSLNYVKCLATNISASNCTLSWLYDVASSGTFVKNSSMSSWTSGTSGIPSNWSVQNA